MNFWTPLAKIFTQSLTRLMAAFFLVGLTLLLSVVNYLNYELKKETTIKEISEKLRNIARASSSYITYEDHEKLKNQILDGNIEIADTAEFKRIKKHLLNAKNSHEIETDIYTYFIPEFDKSLVLFTSMTQEKTYIGNGMKGSELAKSVWNSGEPKYSEKPYTDSEGQWVSGAAPILDEKGNVSGIVEVNYRVDIELQKALNNILWSIFITWLGGITIILGLLYFIPKLVSFAVRPLDEATKKIALGQFDRDMTIETMTEFTSLSKSVSKMSSDLKSLEEEKQNIQMEVEELSQLPKQNPSPVIRSFHNGQIKFSNDQAKKSFFIFEKEMFQEKFDELFQHLVVLKVGDSKSLTTNFKDKFYDVIVYKTSNYLNLYFFDTSELIQVQQNLRVERDKALAASKAKSEFMATMSHEIRTPMNGVLGLTNLMNATPLNKEQKDLVSGILKSSKTMLEIINDILDFSKLQSGKFNIDPQPHNVSEDLLDVFSLFKGVAQESHLTFTLEGPTQKEIWCLYDSVRLRQILSNIVGNAVKFTSEGFVKIICTSDFQKESDTYKIHFRVEDSGLGISKEDQNELFEEFTQADSSATRNFGGTGLGLSISQKLAHLMGSEIKIDSQLGAGSQFYFDMEFPRAEKVESLNLDLSQVRHDFAQQYPLDILVAEDNSVNQVVVQKLFLKLGYKIRLAENGKRLLEEYENTPSDVIFMDMQMPIMDGKTATKKLFEIYGEEAPPIYAMSANALQEDLKEYEELGLLGCVSKPIILKKLIETLAEIISFKFSTTLNLADFIDQKKSPHSEESTERLSPSTSGPEEINLDQVVEALGGDFELFEMIANLYFEEYQTDLSELVRLAELEDDTNLSKAAHKYKGVLRNFGLKKAEKIAETLERELDQLDQEQRLRLLVTLAELSDDISQQLDQIIKLKSA